MKKNLKLIFLILIPLILSAKPLYISNEYFLFENDSLSPSMTHTYEGVTVEGLKDSTLLIFTDPEAYYQKHYSIYCNDYMTLRELYDLYPRAASLKYFYEDHTEIPYKNKKYISLKHTHFAFTGGAHSNTTSQHWIINRKTREIISYNDLFVQNAREKIKVLTDSALKLKFQNNNLENILFSTDYEVSKDVYLTKRGVIFQYDPYEIAAYVYGSIEVFIPYKKLRSVLR
jgi:hypothetical protein